MHQHLLCGDRPAEFFAKFAQHIPQLLRPPPRPLVLCTVQTAVQWKRQYGGPRGILKATRRSAMHVPSTRESMVGHDQTGFDGTPKYSVGNVVARVVGIQRRLVVQ